MNITVTIPHVKKRRIIAAFIGIMLLFALGIAIYYSLESSSLHDTAARNLQSIAELKVGQITQWRRERIANARTTFNSPFFIDGIQAWLRNRSDASLSRKILERLAIIKKEYAFADIFLASTDGDVLLALDSAARRFGARGRALIASVKDSQEIVERDFYRSAVDGKVYYDIMAPVRMERGETIAVLVLRSRPDDYLYPLIRRWPTQSRSSETVLIRKEGESILYLNDLRFREHSALTLRIPLTRTDLPAVQAALGYKGIFEGRDYRGVHTLAYLAPVPQTPWFMVAKIDHSEIFAELTYRTILLAILSAFGFLLVAALFIVYYRSTQLSASADELTKEVERRRQLEEAQERLRQSEEQLRKSRELLAETERSGRIGGWSIDVPTMTQRWTDETFSILEYDLDNGEPKVPEGIDFIAPEYRSQAQAAVEAAITRGEPYDQEWEIVTRKGNRKWVHSVAHVHRTDGQVTRITGSFQDITRRKQAEEKLAAREKEYTTLVEQLDEGFCVIEMAYDEAGKAIDFRFLELNPAFDRHTGLHDAAGKTMREMAPGNEEYWYEIFAQVARTGESVRVEKPAAALNRVFNVFAYRMGAAGSNKVGVIFSDITERLEMEKLMRDVQRREAVGVLSAGIAHDFNNLLSVMMGNVSLAQMNVPKEHPAAAYMTKALTAMETAADLTKQILAYSGKGQFQIATIDLTRELQTHVALFTVSVPKNVRLETHLPQHPIYVSGDPAQIRQIIMNLVINGADAIGDRQGTVTVTVSQSERTAAELLPFTKITNTDLTAGPYAMIEVNDTGRGMSDETMLKIFDPFFTTKFIGRGLGLSATLGIIRAHHGGIAIESREGEGSTFRVLLPVCSDPPAAQRPADEADQEPTQMTGKVLVIDDEQEVAVMARDILETGGYDVLVETNPLRGLDRFREHPQEVGLILLDLTMPEMPGEKVAAELLRIDPAAKIIISSGYSESEVVKRIGSNHIAGVVQKPYHMEAFLSKIRTVMQEPKPQ